RRWTSAANGALIGAQQPNLNGPDSFVLTSIDVADGDDDNVLDMPLENIALVGMMVTNDGDICPVTPPIGVNKIARRLLSSPDFRAHLVTNMTAPDDAR